MQYLLNMIKYLTDKIGVTAWDKEGWVRTQESAKSIYIIFRRVTYVERTVYKK